MKTEEREEKAGQSSAAKKVLNSIRRHGDNDDGEVEGLLSIVNARNKARRRRRGHDTRLGDFSFVSCRKREGRTMKRSV